MNTETPQAESENSRCGYVAIVGRPNVGKSTLLNHLLGQKLSITSRKPQTTRHTLLGIKTEAHYQLIFVDTPGIHTNQEKAINRVMNRSAMSAMADVDAVVFVVDRLEWSSADEYVARQVKNAGAPVIVAVNKVDLVEDKEELLPHLQFVSDQVGAREVIPLSALRQTNLALLEEQLVALMPSNDPFSRKTRLPIAQSGFWRQNSCVKRLHVNLAPNSLTKSLWKSRALVAMNGLFISMR